MVFCIIKSCVNHRNKSNIHKFKIPTGDQGKIWKTIIEKANSENYSKSTITGFICCTHFSSDVVKKKNDRHVLAPNAIPTIFGAVINDVNPVFEDTNIGAIEVICRNCEELTEKCINKDVELMKLNVQIQNVKIQKEKLSVENSALKKEVKSLKISLLKLKNQNDFAEKEIATTNEKLKKIQSNVNFSLDGLFSLFIFISNAVFGFQEIISCLLNGVPPFQKYPESVRGFCISMYYKSPSAYKFLRTTFENKLPEESTMRCWYLNSNLNGGPGINDAALNVIREKVEHKQRNGEKLICALIFDEMSIKKNIQWSHPEAKMLGYPTYGGKPGEPATQAIVYMIVGINERFQIPICYHFITSLDGKQKKELLIANIDKVSETNAKIVCVTFDGHASNISMCKLLGADINIDSPKFQPYFYSTSQQWIHIMFDPVHMMKLVRNAIGKKGVLLNGNMDEIRWSHIENLVEFSKTRGYALTHKMGQKHILFGNLKMNVRVAVETLSASTAESISFLKDKGICLNCNDRKKNTNCSIFILQVIENLRIPKQLLNSFVYLMISSMCSTQNPLRMIMNLKIAYVLRIQLISSNYLIVLKTILEI